jgi:hypothetical protein
MMRGLELMLPWWPTLDEEQAQEFRAQAVAAAAKLRQDPNAPAAPGLSADVSVRSLPDADRESYLEQLGEFFDEVGGAGDAGAVNRTMRHWLPLLLAWQETAEAWEEIGVEQVVLDHGADGPILEPSSTAVDMTGGSMAVGSWVIRAASGPAAGSWLRADRRATKACAVLLTRLTNDPLTPGHHPLKHPFQGTLGSVGIDGQQLRHWQISDSASVTVKRRSSSQIALWQGKVRVMYAPDPAHHVVWVTDVRLHEFVTRTTKVRARSKRPKRR